MSKTQTTFWSEVKIDHREMLRAGVLKQSSRFSTPLWIQAHFTVCVLMVLRAFRRLFLISLRPTSASHFLNEISPMVGWGMRSPEPLDPQSSKRKEILCPPHLRDEERNRPESFFPIPRHV